MAEIIVVVPEEGIEETGDISFKFVIDSDISENVIDHAYGLMRRKKKDDSIINLIDFSNKVTNFAPIDKITQWRIDLVQNGSFLLACSVDSTENELGLQQILKNLPDSIVLVPPEDVEPLTLACSALNFNLSIHRRDGVLSSS